jgi:predicted outer membrane repeat protein
MDTERFDHIARTFSTPETRRGLLRFVAALPLTGVLAALVPAVSEAGRQHRRTAQHRHQTGDATEHRAGQRNRQQVSAAKKKKKKCAQAGQTPKKGTRPKCCAGLVTDASGRCAVSAPSSQPPPTPSPGCTGLKPTDDLQAAIAAADKDATLTLCAGTWKLPYTVGIDKNLTLRGAGAGATTIDGGRPPSGPGGVGVLKIAPGAEVMLQDLTITKGSTVGSGGGINNEGTLTLLGVSVTGNTARDTGGGIRNEGTLTLEAGSHVTGNTSDAIGGGILNYVGTVTLRADSSVSGNTARSSGGGIYTVSGRVTLQAGSRVTGNTAPTGNHGGILNKGSTVTVDVDALVCNNTQRYENQCGGTTITGPCPNPPDGICPA